MAVISEKNSMELGKLLKVDGERITRRYTLIYMQGKHEFFDTSLNEVIFRGTKKEMEVFIQGLSVEEQHKVKNNKM